MKIVERKEWSRAVSCKDCKSKLEIDKNDVQAGSFGTMGDYEIEWYFTCPVCSCQNVLNKFSLPWSVKDPALARLRKEER